MIGGVWSGAHCPYGEPVDYVETQYDRWAARWRIGYIAWGVIVVGLAVGVWSWLSAHSPEAQVKSACEAAVDGQLKAPAGARYEHTLTWEPTPGTWIDNGTVDSPNSFGTLIRSDFRCDIVKDGDGWRIKSAYAD